MFSVFDTQTGNYMHTGRNSKTKQEAIDEIFEWYLEGSDALEEEELELIKKYNLKQKEEWIESIGFRIEKHKEKMEED